jgi:hypothetical protein
MECKHTICERPWKKRYTWWLYDTLPGEGGGGGIFDKSIGCPDFKADNTLSNCCQW